MEDGEAKTGKLRLNSHGPFSLLVKKNTQCQGNVLLPSAWQPSPIAREHAVIVANVAHGPVKLEDGVGTCRGLRRITLRFFRCESVFHHALALVMIHKILNIHTTSYGLDVGGRVVREDDRERGG